MAILIFTIMFIIIITIIIIIIIIKMHPESTGGISVKSFRKN